MSRPGIEPRSPEPLANTLTIMPMSGYIYVYEKEKKKKEIQRMYLSIYE